VLEQATNLTQDLSVTICQVVADLGFRGKEVDAENPQVQIIHRGRYQSLSKQERRRLKRRQAVEPAIWHLKSDHRLDRCWLKGALGDALHAISCAAGYNLRWLLRAIARLDIGPALLRLLQVAPSAARPVSVSQGPRRKRFAPTAADITSATVRSQHTSFALTFA
jgi:transposase, IS5 family